MVRMKVRITGNVQGVSFRWYAKQEADKLGISGYAKNLPDGSVEIVTEGPREKIGIFLRWCRMGPPHAEVENVKILERGKPEGAQGFRMLTREDADA